MPRESLLERVEEPVRTCAKCRRAKSIRGVWYLLSAVGPTHFVCETCYAARTVPLIA